MGETLPRLLKDVRACRVCEAALPLGPRPVVRASTTARLLVVGQAPGTRVHKTGTPWDDASGDRLRTWLGVDRKRFYDEARVAIVPMGFCYPGASGHGGDNPPRPECAPLWHSRLRAKMTKVELTLLVGLYAQKWYLGRRRKKTMTETIRAWRELPPEFLPTPHPSWRSTRWLKLNPWFEEELLPELHRRVHALLD